MMKQTITLLIFGVTFFLIAIPLYFFFYYNQLKEFGVDSAFLETFSVVDKATVQSKNSKIIFLYLRKNNEKMEIKKIYPVTKDRALEKMKDKSVLIESVFHPKPAPYFAVFTTEISCPEEFLPVHRKKEGLWMAWTMFANKRRGFGVCDRSAIFFINHKLLKYCSKQKNLIEINYFIHVAPGMKKIIDFRRSLIQLENLIFCSEEDATVVQKKDHFAR